MSEMNLERLMKLKEEDFDAMDEQTLLLCNQIFAAFQQDTGKFLELIKKHKQSANRLNAVNAKELEFVQGTILQAKTDLAHLNTCNDEVDALTERINLAVAKAHEDKENLEYQVDYEPVFAEMRNLRTLMNEVDAELQLKLERKREELTAVRRRKVEAERNLDEVKKQHAEAESQRLIREAAEQRDREEAEIRAQLEKERAETKERLRLEKEAEAERLRLEEEQAKLQREQEEAEMRERLQIEQEMQERFQLEQQQREAEMRAQLEAEHRMRLQRNQEEFEHRLRLQLEQEEVEQRVQMQKAQEETEKRLRLQREKEAEAKRQERLRAEQAERQANELRIRLEKEAELQKQHARKESETRSRNKKQVQRKPLPKTRKEAPLESPVTVVSDREPSIVDLDSSTVEYVPEEESDFEY